MKQPIRFFSIGLLTSSLILLLAFYFLDEQGTKPKDISVDEMIETIQNDGYKVLTESEYISFSVNSDQAKDEVDDKPDTDDKDIEEENKESDDDEKLEEEDSDIKTYTLNVKPNMLGPEVSELLAKNGIVEDASKFNQLLEDGGYSTYIQLGKHELSSDMNDKEVAKKISNQ